MASWAENEVTILHQSFALGYLPLYYMNYIWFWTKKNPKTNKLPNCIMRKKETSEFSGLSEGGALDQNLTTFKDKCDAPLLSEIQFFCSIFKLPDYEYKYYLS